MNRSTFENKVCWITGATGGIGSALTLSLNQSGAYLVLSARNADHLRELKYQCPHPERIMILACDMEQTALIPAMATKAWSIFGGIDYVFLNAGIAVRDTVINTGLDMVEKVMTVNFLSNVAISKTLLPFMKQAGTGCFVVTSSICGKFGVPKLSAYSASKHALHGFFEALRAEYEGFGIRVTIITSGLVRTGITVNGFTGDGKSYGKMQESVGEGIPPQKSAAAILHAVACEKREALIGGIEKYSVLIKRFFPGLHALVIAHHPIKKLRTLGLTRNSSHPEQIMHHSHQIV